MTTARVIAITQPLVEGCPDWEGFIAYVARVSNPANRDRWETSPRLLQYLQREAHWSPFEHVSASVEVTTTRDISRQIIRHRSMYFQEYSGRYSVMQLEPVYREARLQDHEDRQSSLPCDDADLQQWWAEAQRETWLVAADRYREALDRGIAKEQARALLPEGMTPTTIVITGSARSWIHYCALRGANGTQQEHMDVARACLEALQPYWPLVLK